MGRRKSPQKRRIKIVEIEDFSYGEFSLELYPCPSILSPFHMKVMAFNHETQKFGHIYLFMINGSFVIIEIFGESVHRQQNSLLIKILNDAFTKHKPCDTQSLFDLINEIHDNLKKQYSLF